MEKKFQVFVSSTYKDLIEERSEIIQALLELDCIPVGMELFPAGDDDQWTSIKKIIDTCDYYVLIIAGRYGSEDQDGVSYTQLEYEYAISKGIPTIAFIHKTPSELPGTKLDTDKEKVRKLELFRIKAQTKMCRFWNSKNELRSQVSSSIVKLLKEKPRNGWIRAHPTFSEDFLRVGKYISFFTPRRSEFNILFDNTILNAEPGDNIDIIGISQRLTFTDYPGVDVFVDKIKNGCNFRILLLHPDSLLIETIEALSKDYGFAELRKNILSVINGVISELYKKLAKEFPFLSGSLEIRLHKNLFSSISYHSVNKRVLLGLYYSHISGTHCPTFELNDDRARNDAKKHFENLWTKSVDNILVRISPDQSEQTLFLYGEEKFNYTYFEKGLTHRLSNYEPYQWLGDKFPNKALHIIKQCKLNSSDKILDYGCAKGFLVRAFRDLKYQSYGCDISNYAISNSDKGIKDYCFLLKKNQYIPDALKKEQFSTVIFTHVLEHIEVNEIKQILSAIGKITRSIYIEVPLGNGTKFNNSRHENDKTHLHRNDFDWWKKLLEENGYSMKFHDIINDDYAEIFCVNTK